ncbi:MAG: hypothetical protein EBU72_12875 [Betaproteobacteria bacterium]|nr:hypothetical protein [Betaproteobacteria bacterium]
MAMGFDTSLPAARRIGLRDEGFNFLMSVGLMPGVELNGRLATQDLNCNFYYGVSSSGAPCREPTFRDVAASLKVGHSVSLGENWKASASVGATDFGGAATLNRAVYGVAGLNHPRGELNVGLAQEHSSSTPLNGPFASFAWRPHPLLTVYTEHIGRQAWAGGKAFIPRSWIPWSQVRLHLGVHHALTAQNLTAMTTFNAGLTLQLGTLQDASPKRPITLPGVAQEAARAAMAQAQELLSIPVGLVSRQAGAPVDQGNTSRLAPAGQLSFGGATTAVAAPTAQQAGGLAKALASEGLEDIYVGATPNTRIVRFENTVYRWNDLEAVGKALAQLLHLAEPVAFEPQVPVELQLTKLGIVTARVAGTPECLRLWLMGVSCPDGALVHLDVGLKGGWWNAIDPQWVVQGSSPSRFRIQGRVTPALDYRVGTEYGSLDATVGANLVAQVSPWRGAHLDVAHLIPMYDSDDYRAGAYFSEFRILRRTHRILLHQSVDLGSSFTARAAVGRVGTIFEGGMGELRWQPGDGRHRMGYQWARFDNTLGGLGKQTSMANYRYWFSPLQTAIELSAGQFWNTDRGWSAAVRHWFDDVSVTTYYRESRFAPQAAALSPYGTQNVKALGIEFTFPLTPRREWSGDRWRFGFSDRMGLGLETAVKMPDNTNYLIPYHGRFPPVPMSLNGVAYNFDRMSRSYLQENTHLIRRAYRRAASELAATAGVQGRSAATRFAP